MSTPPRVLGQLCSSVAVIPARAPPRSSPLVPESRLRHELRLTSSTEFSSPPSSSYRSPHRNLHLWWTCCVNARRISCRSAAYAAETERMLVPQNASLRNLERDDRIRKQMKEPEFLPSAYDTAWVAMVPLPGSSPAPCFPQCVQWILQNQDDDGSWGTNQQESDSSSSPNKKHILLSTLACVVALRKWSVGLDHIRRGLDFIGRNFPAGMDEQTDAPVGFHLTFPAMLSLGSGMGLEFPVKGTSVDGILQLYEMEVKRLAGEKSSATESYLAYVAEGVVNLLDRNEVKKFQRNNGSLFNSPSATAAGLLHNYDDKALQYLNLLVSKFGSAVPTMYPQNIHCQLSMVDILEKIGISRYFSCEIKSILDMTYNFWLQRDEELIMDIETCAIAFRLLRLNGYDVSSDELSHVVEASTFHNSLHGYLNDTKSILELYKASKVSLSANELILEKIGSWSGSLLTEMLCSDEMQRRQIIEEVEHNLRFPLTVEPLDHKWNIEHFDARNSQMLKTKYLPCRVRQDVLDLAVEDFRFSQSAYQDELQQVSSWGKEYKLDQLWFLRQKLTYCYLCAATAITPHELSDARIACAKSTMLTIVVDDFFDVGGSEEEQQNLLKLVEKWDEHSNKDDFYSEQVEIVFSVLFTTVNQLAAIASAVQNHDVTKHVIELWLQALTSMFTEAEWRRSQYVPTVEEYMANAVYSIIVSPCLHPAQYLLGEILTEDMVKDEEYNELCRLTSTCARLLNDIWSVERESKEGKLNSVSLLVLHSGGSMTMEAAKEATWRTIDSCTRDLLRLVLLREDSVVPRPCKELFWGFCKVAHLFYFQTDGFTSPKEMVSVVNAVINEPLKLKG